MLASVKLIHCTQAQHLSLLKNVCRCGSLLNCKTPAIKRKVIKKASFLGISHRSAGDKKGDCTSTVPTVLSCGAEPEMMEM